MRPTLLSTSDDAGAYQYSVDTAMLQSYHDASAFEQLKILRPRRNETGELDILGLDSLSRICFLFQDPGAEAGWEMATPDIKCNIISVAPAINDGAQRMFGARDIEEGKKTEIIEIFCHDDKTVDYRKIAVVDRACTWDSELKCGVATIHDRDDCFLVLSGGKGKWSAIINAVDGEWFYTYNNESTWYSIEDLEGILSPLYPDRSCGVWPELKLVEGVKGSVIADTPWGRKNWPVPPNISMMIPDGTRGTIDGHPSINYNREAIIFPESNPMPSIRNYSMVMDSGGRLNCIAICSDSWDPEPYRGKIFAVCSQWDGTVWSTPQEISSTIGENIDGELLTSFDARLNMKGQIELSFLSRITNRLLHSYQYFDGEQALWTSWIPIADDCQTIGVGQFRNGFTQIFDDAVGDKSLRVFYQPETSDAAGQETHDWSEELILWTRVDSSRDEKLYTGQAYRTCISVFDSNGSPVSGAKCGIDASDYVYCHANGRFWEIQPGHPVKLETNVLGQINIEYILDSSLYSPSFSIIPETGEYMIVCQPDRDTVTALQNVTADDLTKILPGKDNSQTAEAIRHAAGLLKQFYAPYEGDTSIFADNVNLNGVSVVKKSYGKLSKKLDPQLLDQQAYMFSVASGTPVFTEISRSEFDNFRRSATDAREAFPETFGGLFDFFGDVWEAAKDIGGAVIDLAWSGTTAVVKFVVDGVTYVVDAIVETARDVFDVVGAIFDQLGVIIGTVLVWALELLGFLFDWDKIIETKEKIKEMANEGFVSFRTWLEDNSQNIENKIDDFIKMLPGKMQTDSGKISTMPTASTIPTSYGTNIRSDIFTVDGTCFWNSGTWLIDIVIDKIFNGGLPDFDAKDNLKVFGDKLLELGKLFEDSAKDEFDKLKNRAIEVFGKFMENPESVLKLTLDSLIEMFMGLLDSIISLIKAVLTKGVELIHRFTDILLSLFEWLDKEIYIPFVSSFYNTVIKSKLSIMDFVCLVAAIPSTIAVSIEFKSDYYDNIKDTDLKKKLVPIATGIIVSFAEMFALVGNQPSTAPSGPDQRWSFNFWSIASNVCAGVAGGIWITYDAMHVPTGWFGVVMLAQSVLDIAGTIYIWYNKVDPSEGRLKLLLPGLEAIAGGAGLVAGIWSIVIGAKDSSTPDILMGVASILIGIRYFISGVADISKVDKNNATYIEYVVINTAIVASLFIAAGAVGSEKTEENLLLASNDLALKA